MTSNKPEMTQGSAFGLQGTPGLAPKGQKSRDFRKKHPRPNRGTCKDRGSFEKTPKTEPHNLQKSGDFRRTRPERPPRTRKKKKKTVRLRPPGDPRVGPKGQKFERKIKTSKATQLFGRIWDGLGMIWGWFGDIFGPILNFLKK